MNVKVSNAHAKVYATIMSCNLYQLETCKVMVKLFEDCYKEEIQRTEPVMWDYYEDELKKAMNYKEVSFNQEMIDTTKELIDKINEGYKIAHSLTECR